MKAKLGSVDSSLFFGGRVGPLGGGLILHLKMLQIVLKNLNVLKYNNLYVCNYLDILFLIAWTVNTRQFLGPNVWYRLNFLCLKCSSDLLCSVCDMTLKSSYCKRSLLFYINMSKIFFWNFEKKIIQDLFYYIVQIFCLWFYTADLIMDVIAQVSNVAHGHFVFLHHGFFRSGDVLIF